MNRESKMRILRIVVAAACVLGFAAALYAVGPDWPKDKYKAFAEAKKKNKLIFLYFTSTS